VLRLAEAVAQRVTKVRAFTVRPSALSRKRAASRGSSPPIGRPCSPTCASGSAAACRPASQRLHVVRPFRDAG